MPEIPEYYDKKQIVNKTKLNADVNVLPTPRKSSKGEERFSRLTTPCVKELVLIIPGIFIAYVASITKIDETILATFFEGLFAGGIALLIGLIVLYYFKSFRLFFVLYVIFILILFFTLMEIMSSLYVWIIVILLSVTIVPLAKYHVRDYHFEDQNAIRRKLKRKAKKHHKKENLKEKKFNGESISDEVSLVTDFTSETPNQPSKSNDL